MAASTPTHSLKRRVWGRPKSQHDVDVASYSQDSASVASIQTGSSRRARFQSLGGQEVEQDLVRCSHRRVTHTGTFKTLRSSISLSTYCDDDVLSDSFEDLLSSSAGTANSFEDLQTRPGTEFETSVATNTIEDLQTRPRTELENSVMRELEEQEAQVTWLNLKIQRQQEEIRTIMREIEQDRQQVIETEKRIASQKASLAVEQGGGPAYWGISVQQLEDFAASISTELRDYCLCHRCEIGSWTHVCTSPNCQHDHGCCNYRSVREGEDPTKLPTVKPNMHTVVPLFIKPRTRDRHGIRGLALQLNEARPKKVEKFVSHSWSGRFEDFVETLHRNMLPETVVFVCSFALPQNLDIAPILNTPLEQTPFAAAHNIASEIWLVIDKSIDVIERVWVIYELYLSLLRNKPIRIASTEMGPHFHKAIMGKVCSLDVRQTKATKDADLKSIMAAINGMEDRLNGEMRAKLSEQVHQLNMLAEKVSQLDSPQRQAFRETMPGLRRAGSF